MNIYEVMIDSPWLTFFILLALIQVTGQIVVNLPNRILRHWNIRKHGYPPEHCDADGDFRDVESEEEES